MTTTEETGQTVVEIGMLEVLTMVELLITSVSHDVPQMVEVVIGGGGQLEVVWPTTLWVVGGRGKLHEYVAGIVQV